MKVTVSELHFIGPMYEYSFLAISDEFAIDAKIQINESLTIEEAEERIKQLFTGIE